MNEIEKLDLIIDRLVSTKSRLSFHELNTELGFKISREEAKYLLEKLIDDGIVEELRTSIGDNILTVKYTHETQKFLDQGGYASQEEQNRINNIEKIKIKNIEDQKLISEARLVKWQVKTFWWIFLIALFGGICGIISLIMQLSN